MLKIHSAAGVILVLAVFAGCGKNAEELKAEKQSKENALRLAAAKGDLDAIQDLLKEGVSADAADGGGVTALMKAAAHGNPVIIRELLAAGAQVNAKDARGDSVLIYAVNDTLERSGEPGLDREEAVRELVEQGADVHATGNRGMSVLMKASAFGNVDLVRQIVKAGADLEAKDVNGMTALMWAANQPVSVHDTEATVEFLIEAGADVRAKSNSGYTALDYARRHNSNPEIVRMIEDADTSEMAENDKHKPEADTDQQSGDLMSDLLSIPGRVMKQLPELQKSIGRTIPAADLAKVQLACSMNESKVDGVMSCNVRNGSDWILQALEIEFRGSTAEGQQEVRQFVIRQKIKPGEAISVKRDTGIYARISVASYSILYAVGTQPSSESDPNETQTTL